MHALGVVRRLNWGCGHRPRYGWINADRVHRPGVDLCGNILDGLPLDTDSIDYIASIHALSEVPYHDLTVVLGELHRVLKPNSVLRLAVPDLERNIQAYLHGDANHFLIPDTVSKTLGGKFARYLVWYGENRSLFTPEYLVELLTRVGFRDLRRCAYRETKSIYGDIVALDDRQGESLFMEAVK